MAATPAEITVFKKKLQELQQQITTLRKQIDQEQSNITTNKISRDFTNYLFSFGFSTPPALTSSDYSPIGESTITRLNREIIKKESEALQLQQKIKELELPEIPISSTSFSLNRSS